MYDFWLPYICTNCFKIPGILFIVASGAVMVGSVLVVRNHQAKRADVDAGTAFQALSVLFAVTYVAFLFLSISLVDCTTPADARIMLPVHVVVVIQVVSLAWCLSIQRRSPHLWWAFLVFAAVLIGLNMGHTFTTVSGFHNGVSSLPR